MATDRSITTLPTSGLVAVAVTPLDDDGNIDTDSIHALMQFYLDCGVSGVALLGVMGEANRMTDSEARLVVSRSLEALQGRVPAIVGISDPSLERMTSLAEYSIEAGAVGVLLQPMAGLTGNQALIDYYHTVASSLEDIAICVQDFPRANGVHIPVAAWKSIVQTCPSVIMLKHEDEPGLNKLSSIRSAEKSGLRRVTILTGNNGIHLVQELYRGADGAMTGFAFPDVLASVINLHRSGQVKKAEDLFDTYLPINRHELRTGIQIRKETLRRRGVIRTAKARYPAPALTDNDHLELDRLLDRLESTTGRTLEDIVKMQSDVS